jgi:tripartite-type tricarboxylate transporter receptor subunit TctC
MKMRRLARFVLTLAMLGSTLAHAQTSDTANYPNRAIRIIVGFGPGGGTDILARLVGQKLAASLGQPVVIENKPGAGAIVAAEFVKSQRPDGYTLLLGASGAMAINPAVYTRLPYNVQRDFAPISSIAAFPLIVVVHPDGPKSIGDLVAQAKAHPDTSNYASSSTAFQLATELFKQRTGAPLTHIPYKSSNESVTAVISGQVLVTIADAGPAAGQIAGGRVRALAVTSAARNPQWPQVPTLAEAGVPDMELELWAGLFAPAGTPPEIVEKLQREVARIVRLPDIEARMTALAVSPVGNTAEDFRRTIAADTARWTAVAKASHIKIEP